MSQLQQWPVAVDAPFDSVSGIGVDFSSAHSKAYLSVDFSALPIAVFAFTPSLLPPIAHSSILRTVSSAFGVPLYSFLVVASRLSGSLQQVKCTCWRPFWSARARPLGPDAKIRSITNEGAIMICVGYPSAACVRGRSEGAIFSSQVLADSALWINSPPVYLLAFYCLKL